MSGIRIINSWMVTVLSLCHPRNRSFPSRAGRGTTDPLSPPNPVMPLRQRTQPQGNQDESDHAHDASHDGVRMCVPRSHRAASSSTRLPSVDATWPISAQHACNHTIFGHVMGVRCKGGRPYAIFA